MLHSYITLVYSLLKWKVLFFKYCFNKHIVTHYNSKWDSPDPEFPYMPLAGHHTYLTRGQLWNPKVPLNWSFTLFLWKKCKKELNFFWNLWMVRLLIWCSQTVAIFKRRVINYSHLMYAILKSVYKRMPPKIITSCKGTI